MFTAFFRLPENPVLINVITTTIFPTIPADPAHPVRPQVPILGSLMEKSSPPDKLRPGVLGVGKVSIPLGRGLFALADPEPFTKTPEDVPTPTTLAAEFPSPDGVGGHPGGCWDRGCCLVRRNTPRGCHRSHHHSIPVTCPDWEIQSFARYVAQNFQDRRCYTWETFEAEDIFKKDDTGPLGLGLPFSFTSMD